MTILLWLGFITFVFAALALDLGVLNRREREIKTREALILTGIYVALAMAFSLFVYYIYERNLFGIASGLREPLGGKQAALQFITGYVVEESLSVDNMIVIAFIFSYFQVPRRYQHRVLFWGILGALIMRGAMIATGTALLAHFEWILYVFGAMLLVTALRLLFMNESEMKPDQNILVRLTRRMFAVTDDYHGTHFFVRQDGRRKMTLLFVVLMVVESSDVMFAVDSIPAVIAVTHEPFLVFTSNVFAILGLRSLYFALAGMVEQFEYLKSSLVVLLAFIGIKMIIEPFYSIPTGTSFLVIVGILSVGIVASLAHTWSRNRRARRHPPVEGGRRSTKKARGKSAGDDTRK